MSIGSAFKISEMFAVTLCLQFCDHLVLFHHISNKTHQTMLPDMTNYLGSNLPKRDAGNPTRNTLSKITSVIFSACKRSTGTCLQL